MTSNNKILCLGNISFDVMLKEKHALEEINFVATPGGSVLNTAIQLARLGLDVTMLSKTGTDFFSDSLINTLHAEGISTKYIVRNKNLRTGLAFAKINAKGDSSYIFYKPQTKDTGFTQQEVPSSLFSGVSVLHAASAYTYNDYTFNSTLSLFKEAKKKNVFISYDPNWRPGRMPNTKKACKRIFELISYVDLLKLSAFDAMDITETPTIDQALKKLPDGIVVTLGEKGSFYKKGTKKVKCPTFKVNVKDTIGAGDAFTAGLIYKYCQNGKENFLRNPKADLEFASAASSIVCRGKGATTSLKSAHQVDLFLRDLH